MGGEGSPNALLPQLEPTGALLLSPMCVVPVAAGTRLQSEAGALKQGESGFQISSEQ